MDAGGTRVLPLTDVRGPGTGAGVNRLRDCAAELDPNSVWVGDARLPCENAVGVGIMNRENELEAEADEMADSADSADPKDWRWGVIKTRAASA